MRVSVNLGAFRGDPFQNLTLVHVRLIVAMASTTPQRRTPVQRRSRERVERILEAADRLVTERGVDALTTRAVARAADVPVASLYQYFADREAIIVALIERQVEAMDEQLAADLTGLDVYSVRTLVETVVHAYVAGYRKRPGYVVVWFQGRVAPDVRDYVFERSHALAASMHAFTTSAGIMRADTDARVLVLVSEMIDAFLAFAYREDVRGDQRVVAEGIEMIVRYLEPHATPAGLRGIPAADVQAGPELGA